MAVAVDDAVFGNVFFPEVVCLDVLAQPVFLGAFEHGHIQAVFVNLEHFGQIFPRPGNGFFLEIIAERPVAQHFEHGVVIGVLTHFFEVVVLAGHAQAFLRVGHAVVHNRRIAQNHVFELVHARIGEHQCRVVFDDHRCRWYDLVVLGSEELQEALSNFRRGHSFLCRNVDYYSKFRRFQTVCKIRLIT